MPSDAACATSFNPSYSLRRVTGSTISSRANRRAATQALAELTIEQARALTTEIDVTPSD